MKTAETAWNAGPHRENWPLVGTAGRRPAGDVPRSCLGRQRSGSVPSPPVAPRERTIPQVGAVPCAARSRSACRPEVGVPSRRRHQGARLTRRTAFSQQLVRRARRNPTRPHGAPGWERRPPAGTRPAGPQRPDAIRPDDASAWSSGQPVSRAAFRATAARRTGTPGRRRRASRAGIPPPAEPEPEFRQWR